MPEMDLSVKIGIASFLALLVVALVRYHVYFSPAPPRGEKRDEE